ncbi:MAG: hypothetical protein AAGF12_22120 [Myxococcota bacterium]
MPTDDEEKDEEKIVLHGTPPGGTVGHAISKPKPSGGKLGTVEVEKLGPGGFIEGDLSPVLVAKIEAINAAASNLASAAGCESDWTVGFSHADWKDGVHVVQAEGPHGFNQRFHELRADLKGAHGDIDTLFKCVNNLRGDAAEAVDALKDELAGMLNRLAALEGALADRDARIAELEARSPMRRIGSFDQEITLTDEWQFHKGVALDERPDIVDLQWQVPNASHLARYRIPAWSTKQIKWDGAGDPITASRPLLQHYVFHEPDEPYDLWFVVGPQSLANQFADQTVTKVHVWGKAFAG